MTTKIDDNSIERINEIMNKAALEGVTVAEALKRAGFEAVVDDDGNLVDVKKASK